MHEHAVEVAGVTDLTDKTRPPVLLVVDGEVVQQRAEESMTDATAQDDLVGPGCRVLGHVHTVGPRRDLHLPRRVISPG